MRKYRVRKPMHILVKVSSPIPSYVRTCCGGRYEVMTNKSRFYEGTRISFIRG